MTTQPTAKPPTPSQPPSHQPSQPASPPADTAAPLRAAIYARQSVTRNKAIKEDSKLSTTDQISRCQDLCKRCGYVVVATFEELNRASYTYPNTVEGKQNYAIDKALQKFLQKTVKSESEYLRDELGKLFDILDKIDVIVVNNSDRLYRSIPDSNVQNFMRVTLIENNILINSVEEGIEDYRNNQTYLTSGIKTIVKSSDLINKRDASIRGVQQLKKDGYIPIPRLTGYDKMDMICNPNDKFDIVKEMFNKFLNGIPKNQILKYLAKNGIIKSMYALDIMLKNPLYAGYFYNDGELVISKNMGENQQFAMITIDEWKQVQNRLKSYPRISRSPNREYIHTGLIRCGYCGGIMRVQVSSRGEYMRCANWVIRHSGNGDCKSNQIRLNNWKNGGIQLNMILRQSSLVAHTMSKFALQSNKEIDGKIEVLKFDLDKVKKSIEEITNDIVDSYGDATKVKMLKNIAYGLADKETSIKADIANLEKNIKPVNNTVSLQQSLDEIEKLPAIEVNKLLKQSYKMIEVFSDKVVFTGINYIQTYHKRIAAKSNDRYTRTVLSEKMELVELGEITQAELVAVENYKGEE